MGSRGAAGPRDLPWNGMDLPKPSQADAAIIHLPVF